MKAFVRTDMRKKILIMLMAWSMPTYLLAVDQEPEMTGTLGGTPHEWFILSHGKDSNASFIEMGDEIHIDITGFIDPETWSAQDALSMSLIMQEEELVSADVIQLIGYSPQPPLHTSEAGDIRVSVIRYERDARTVRVAGTVQGVLALQVEVNTPPSIEEGIEVDVQFNVEARKIEF